MNIPADLNLQQEMLASCIIAAKKAGAAILEVYHSGSEVTIKSDNSPLTLADQKSHEIILEFLRRYYPQIPLLSEEGSKIPYQERKVWEYFWLVDPLDGTKEFINRNGEFTVNIALIYKNRPILGVIYIPVADIFYFAAEAVGAFKLNGPDIGNQQLLQIIRGTKPVLKIECKEIFQLLLNSAQKLPHYQANALQKEIKIVASKSHMSAETAAYIEKKQSEYDRVEIVSKGSSLKFCLIAEGLAQYYPRFGPTMEWDTAAGQAIVELANGRVYKTDTNETLTYNKESLLNPWFIAESVS
jgi:3'(2'), 5'-bisphosphate nucleotidase